MGCMSFLTFLFCLLIVYDNIFRSLYHFVFVSITVDKMSVEVKVESVLREIKVLFHRQL